MTECSQRGRPAPYFLYVALFFSGAALLVVEILGTRLLSPYFGSNLYVWSALISVTLLALAAGYWAGGRAADSRGSPLLLDLILAGAGVLVAASPGLVSVTAGRLVEMRFEAAILIAALLYFGPPLFLLGMVGPVAVRLTAPDLAHVGRSAGAASFWSTAGSVVGALAAGFLLLPRLPPHRICYATATLLLALAAMRGLSQRIPSRAGALAGLLLLLPGWLFLRPAPPSRLPAERGFRVVAEQPSYYGTVRVVESDRLRYMLVDGSVQTMQTLGGYPLFRYTWTFGLIPYLRPDAKSLLLIGLGGGDLVKLMNRYGIRTTAVEVNPAVAQSALTHFALRRDEFQLEVEDGRRYLRRSRMAFDSIVLDAFSGSCPPMHLFSQEAFAEMKARLGPTGLVAVNLVTRGWHDPVVGEVAATLSSVFAHLLVFPTEEDQQRLGNVVVLASDAPLDIPSRLAPPPASRAHAKFLDGLRGRTLDSVSLTGRIIRDEHNAIDLRSASTDIEARATYRAHFPASVLF